MKTYADCDCPICAAASSMRGLSAAHDAWVEQSGETEMKHAWLVQEVQATLRNPLAIFVRRRLKKALELCR